MTFLPSDRPLNTPGAVRAAPECGESVELRLGEAIPEILDHDIDG
jgi:hypothetical protein